jgi:hypothetical protein
MAAFELKQAEVKAEDATFVQSFVAPACINSVTSEHLNITVMRTPYSRLALSIIYPAEYPQAPLIVELTSTTLPKPLLEEGDAWASETRVLLSAGLHSREPLRALLERVKASHDLV